VTRKTISATSAAITQGALDDTSLISITSAWDVGVSSSSAILTSYPDVGTIKTSATASGVEGAVLTTGGTVAPLAGGILSRGSVGISVAETGGFIANSCVIDATAAHSTCRARPEIERAAGGGRLR
jgi:hypothetical protein